MYGEKNLADQEDWLMSDVSDTTGVRIITAAPEVLGVLIATRELSKRGVVYSIGHSVASSVVATDAVLRGGAKLITHLFNAMPQLHHRDPSIIGLLGASPHLASPFSPITAHPAQAIDAHASMYTGAPSSVLASGAQSPIPAKGSEALHEADTPPQTPVFKAEHKAKAGMSELKLSAPAPANFERPFYEMIVDGVHSHPNSVRVRPDLFICPRWVVHLLF
jgi:N-acetylglucosamine-6-phosphate deacetylase